MTTTDRPGRTTGSTRTTVLFAVAGVLAIALVAWALLAPGSGTPLPPPSAAALASGPLLSVPGYDDRKFPAELAYKLDRLDPANDGWDTEVLNGAIGKQLSALGKIMAHPGEMQDSDVAEFAAADFRCTRLRPADRAVTYEGATLRVSRGTLHDGEPDLAEFRGPDGLARAVRDLLAPYGDAEEIHKKIKLVRIVATTETVETQLRLEIAGPAAEGRFQQNTEWQARWSRPVNDEPPLLEAIRVTSYEEIVGASDHALFEDRTETVLGDNQTYREQLAAGQTHWAAVLDVAFGSQLLGHDGLAVGDVNGDGLDDVYVTQGGGLPNRLFVQQPDGTALDTSADAGVDYLDPTSSALILDFDNDGDQDLVVSAGPLIFLSNDGSGRFEVEAVVPSGPTFSLAAADFDNDGDLDLYACRYGSPEKDPPAPYHDANNGTPNLALRNDGGWRFTDVTSEVGLDENNLRYSFAASWADYDDDGDQDLYVANDFGRNNLYRNDGGRFRDVAAEAGVEDISAGMSVSWGDYNGDGLLDLYISNMWSSAGQRTTYQRQFQRDADEAVRGQFQRHARGNSLFENAGDGSFRDVSVDANVTMARWAWGSKFVDINNDGLEDLFALNGYVTNHDPDDL